MLEAAISCCLCLWNRPVRRCLCSFCLLFHRGHCIKLHKEKGLRVDSMGAVGSTDGERDPLLGPNQAEPRIQPVISSGRVYRRRWLVLILFSLLAFLQGMVWNTWGPIQNSAKHAFGFSSTDIAILVIWGPVGFIPWLLFVWLMDKKG